MPVQLLLVARGHGLHAIINVRDRSTEDFMSARLFFNHLIVLKTPHIFYIWLRNLEEYVVVIQGGDESQDLDVSL